MLVLVEEGAIRSTSGNIALLIDVLGGVVWGYYEGTSFNVLLLVTWPSLKRPIIGHVGICAPIKEWISVSLIHDAPIVVLAHLKLGVSLLHSRSLPCECKATLGC